MTPLIRPSLSLRSLRRCLRRGLREQFLLCLLQAQPKDLLKAPTPACRVCRGFFAMLEMTRLEKFFSYRLSETDAPMSLLSASAH
jgi:hypothetical protein